MRDYQAGLKLKDKKLELDEYDERNLADLLIDQIEFCNLLLVTKSDLIS